MRRCPFCAEEIQEDAKRCRWCGSDLTGPAGPVIATVSGKATASLILGLFFFILPTAVLAIVFGHLSRGEIRRSAGRVVGEGRALAGLILGYMGVAGLPLILILAAIAIPNLLRSRMAANQASAAASLRTLNTSAITYSSTYNRGFPPSLAGLGPPSSGNATENAAGLIDEVLASGTKSGYRFTYQAAAPDEAGRVDNYTINADPVSPGQTGQNHYYTDQSNVIRQEKKGPASAESPPIGE